MKQSNLACVLSIAGTDPSGGAGIHADIKAISATGGYAAAVVTALVAQNTQGVQAIEAVSADFVQQQLESVFTDVTINAVKIGMLHDQRIIKVICKTLASFKPNPVVFDPVMVAKDGSLLLHMETMTMLKEDLFPLVHLITPNLFEAEQLLQCEITDKAVMQAAAVELGKAYDIHVLIKGGHLNASVAPDVLYDVKANQCHWFEEKRVETKNTHGTGCSLSSAIASYLAQGLTLIDAVKTAKHYISRAIESGKDYSLGKGNGPIDHFYFLGNRCHDH